MPQRVKFNVPTLVGKEFEYLREALDRGHISGNGHFAKLCQSHIGAVTGGGRALLTHSATAALEMAMILSGIEAGDEVIMPSFTFASTANAVVLRGGVPVFIDIREDTLNVDETLIEAAITSKTKAICPVHYAGVSCDMDRICTIAGENGLRVVEDAAQGLHASYRGRPLGSFGDFSAFSFHETKNIIAGEGGALVVNDPDLAVRAEIIWEKGTNRAQFYRGEVSKYTWVDIGSSYLPSEMTAAFLMAQLEDGPAITQRRKVAWSIYQEGFASLEAQGRLRRPVVPPECEHNAHIYYVLLPDASARQALIDSLETRTISSVIHYVPLHSAPAGLKYGRVHGSMQRTDDLSGRLLRLPLHAQITPEEQSAVIRGVEAALA